MKKKTNTGRYTETGYYRDQSKRDRTPYWGQVQKWVTNAYTPKEWQQAFKDHLTWKEKIEFLTKVNPVPKEIKAESGISVTLNITGLDKPKEIQGELVEPLSLTDGSDE